MPPLRAVRCHQAGTIAAATNPLDVIKTRLQTQHLFLAAGPSGAARAVDTPPRPHATVCRDGVPSRYISWPFLLAAGAPASTVALRPRALLYEGVLPACAAIFREAGTAGFFRGTHARMLVHAPSVALCWTTYEAIKRLLDRVAS